MTLRKIDSGLAVVEPPAMSANVRHLLRGIRDYLSAKQANERALYDTATSEYGRGYNGGARFAYGVALREIEGVLSDFPEEKQ